MPPRQAASSPTTSSRAVEKYDYKNITATELKGKLDAGDRPVLLDVREPWEFELASLEGSKLIPMSQLEERFTELDPASETVVICHHGNRSSYVTQAFQRAGFEKVFNLEGGLDAYSFVDETVPRY
jgi:rhodanese-related sulfurtransferase